MTLRLVLLFVIVALAITPQQAPTKAEDDGFAFLINEPDLAGWDGNRHAWKLEGSVVTGRSDGSSLPKNVLTAI